MRAAAPRSPPRAAVPRDASARRSSLRSASLTVSSPSISQPDGVPAPRPGPHRSSFADQSVASRAGALWRKEVLTLHDHPLHSGAREQGICRRSPIQHAAIEQPPEDVLTLAPAVEPVAELIEVGLQV